MCSHDLFFRTNKESSIWRQNDHAKIVGAFHLPSRVSDENRACSISIRFFFKIKDPFDGRSFLMCSHDSFFGTNKNRILKDGLCERAFIMFYLCRYTIKLLLTETSVHTGNICSDIQGAWTSLRSVHTP